LSSQLFINQKIKTLERGKYNVNER
jgi:hypothetical protein